MNFNSFKELCKYIALELFPNHEFYFGYGKDKTAFLNTNTTGTNPIFCSYQSHAVGNRLEDNRPEYRTYPITIILNCYDGIEDDILTALNKEFDLTLNDERVVVLEEIGFFEFLDKSVYNLNLTLLI